VNERKTLLPVLFLFDAGHTSVKVAQAPEHHIEVFAAPIAFPVRKPADLRAMPVPLDAAKLGALVA
jgi:hypothetical protein